MISILFLLAGVLQQPPAPPVTPVDSTVRAISEIGVKVAEMRSVYDLYRRAAFNEPDGALVQRATMFKASCRELAAAVQQTRGYLCRSCLVRRIQADVDQYRAYMPQLQRLGTACASRLEQVMARADAAARHRALRSEANPQGARMVAVLRGYEARLQKVRIDFNWTTAAPPPRPR